MSRARTEAISIKPAEAPPNDAIGDAFAEGCEFIRKYANEFFAKLAEEIRAPHTGDQHRATINDLLRRAETAGLYSPQQES